jgi:outer membrane cobalamin receptor
VATIAAAWLALGVATGVQGQVPSEVRGRVTDRARGTAIADARIDVADGERLAVTDADGDFVVRGLVPGAYSLRASAVGFRPATIDIAVENGRSARLAIALEALAVRLPEVRVRERPDTTGGATTTISRTMIDASGQRDVGALLDQQSGVLVTRRGGPGGPATVSIGGSTANEILVLVDGVRLNSPMTGEADLSLIPLAQVESITIVRGAEAARFGGGALGGVVLIETRRPTGTMLSAEARGGSRGDREGILSGGIDVPSALTGSVTADRRMLTGDFPYDVPAVRGGGTAVRANDAAATSSLSASVASSAWPIAVGAHGMLASTQRGIAGSIDAPSAFARSGDTRLSGGVDAEDASGPVHWSADLAADNERTTYRDPSPPIGPPYDDTVRATSVVGTAVATLPLHPVAFTMGSEVRVIHVAATELTVAAPATERDEGLWAQAHASVPLRAGTILTADAAVRADWDPFVRGTVVSPRVTIAATHGPFVASMSGGSAFNPPTLADQFFHEGVLVAPNPDLRPERVHDDLEARLALRDVGSSTVRISGDIAVYRADVTGMILWFPDYRFVWSPDNVDVRRRGWEGSGALSFPTIGAELRGNLTDVAVEYAGPVLTGQVPYRPRVTAAVGGAETVGRIHTEVSLRYIGDRRTVDGSSINALGAYWITDAHATVRILSGRWPLDALGGVDDVFDRRATLLIDYPYPGRTWTFGLRFATPR